MPFWQLRQTGLEVRRWVAAARKNLSDRKRLRN